MKKAAMILLVVLLVLLAFPLGVGMAMGMPTCPDCALLGVSGMLGTCLAVLAAISIALPALATTARAGSRVMPLLLLAIRVERPPRPV